MHVTLSLTKPHTKVSKCGCSAFFIGRNKSGKKKSMWPEQNNGSVGKVVTVPKILLKTNVG